MINQAELCVFCQQNFRRPGDRFCCDGCDFLSNQAACPLPAAQMAFSSAERISEQSPEDRKLVTEFGEVQVSATHFFCLVDPLGCESCFQGLVGLKRTHPSLLDLEWDRRNSILKLSFVPGEEKPSEVFRDLKSMALKPQWMTPKEAGSQLAGTQVLRQSLLRLGVVAALAANIMMFAVAIYAGLSEDMRWSFEILQGLLFLPILFWGAQPIYKTAWTSFKLRQLSVDVPLALAFLLGASLSYISLGTGGGQLYFDSLAGFLFLILLSRFSLERSLHKYLQSPSLETLLDLPNLEQLQVGQVYSFTTGQRIPADGVLQSEAAEIDTSWLDGEMHSRVRLKGSIVPAGARVLGRELRLQLTTLPRKTAFAELVQSLKIQGDRLQSQVEARLGQILVVLCLSAIGAMALFFSHIGSEEMLKRSLALLIVACPCAISFASPLARARAGHLARRIGFWIKRPQVWDRLAQVRRIAFDKTGTLTEGMLRLKADSPIFDERLKRIILSLENQSQHPIAESLRKTWGAKDLFSVENAKEVPGLGVEGWINGSFYQLQRKLSSEGQSQIVLLKDHKFLADLDMEESPKPQIQEALSLLREQADIFLLSGDSSPRVHSLAQKLGIQVSHAWGSLTPQKKQEALEKIEPDLFVGDGTNDLLAMQKAPVAIATPGAAVEAKSAADIVMMGSDVNRLPKLLVLAQETRRVIRRNFGIALFYNLTAGAFALAGEVDPLAAAVLMPISSFALAASTLIGTQALRAMGSSK